MAYLPRGINRKKGMPSNHAGATSGELKKRVDEETIQHGPEEPIANEPF